LTICNSWTVDIWAFKTWVTVCVIITAIGHMNVTISKRIFFSVSRSSVIWSSLCWFCNAEQNDILVATISLRVFLARHF
jgi:hypothetical protein